MLLQHGGNPLMVDWYYSYITHHNMYIDINGHKISCTTSLGFPQGGVCSTKFWIIALNAAISILNEHGVLGLGFVHDCRPHRGHEPSPNDEHNSEGYYQLGRMWAHMWTLL